MKKIILGVVALVFASIAFVSCTDPEPLEMQPKKAYTEKYYENLRAFKSTMHERSLCFIWFSNYDGSTQSPGYRFAGLPDSIDIVSLWGGIPKKGTLAWKEMKEAQKVRGMKMVYVELTKLFENKKYERVLGLTYDDIANATTTLDPEGKYPDWCVLYGNKLVKDIFDNDLDGLDMDYEPGLSGVYEDDYNETTIGISGPRMELFTQYVGQFIGPKSNHPEKLLIIDGVSGNGVISEYFNYFVKQAYGSRIDEYSREGAFTWEQSIFTENVGDTWKNKDCGQLIQQASFQPKEGYKGGFGGFIVNRDYNMQESGSQNTIPYGTLRRAIQIQNPAVIK